MKWSGPRWAEKLFLRIGWFIIPDLPEPKLKPPSKKKINEGKLPHCTIAGKVMYTEALAKYNAKRLKNRTENRYLRAYRCQFCESWHLTHKKRYRW